jgi:hypothetical protein
MSISYTSLLALVQPADGTEAGTWGDDVNNGITSILDVAVAGTLNITYDANITLTQAQASSSGTGLGSNPISGAGSTLTSSQYAILLLSGGRGATRTITLPSSSKTYTVINSTTGGFAQSVGGVSVASGEYCTIAYNTSTSSWVKTGTNTASISGVITPANGGTGVNNGSNTLTLSGNVTHAGAFTQAFTATANTAVTLPTSGTLISSVTALPGAVTGTPSSTTYLRGDGTWATVAGGGGGTVTSVAATVPSFLSISGSPITSSGTLAIGYSGTALPVANGGTGVTTLSGLAYGNGTSAFTAATASQIVSAIGTTAVTNATNATNVAVTLDSSGSTFYPTFVSATSGNNGEKASSTLTYIPSTGKLSSTIFVSGNASFYSGASYAIADGPSGFVAAVSSASTFVVDSTEARPAVDNSISAGTGAFRYTTVYAVTGTINTSDARKKTAVSQFTDAEVQAAKLMSKEIGTFKWLDAIQKKGADARTHIGLTVQRAMEIMQSCGLDPFGYGFICYDKWQDSFDPISGQLALAAGDCYAFRYDELNLFIARGLEARLEILEAKAGV